MQATYIDSSDFGKTTCSCGTSVNIREYLYIPEFANLSQIAAEANNIFMRMGFCDCGNVFIRQKPTER